MVIYKLRKYLFSTNALILLFASTFLCIAGVINNKLQKPVIVLSKQETALNINKNIYLFLHLGNKRLITDLLWVQTLIESDLEHYAKKDLNNWLFLRFNTISTLDPKFYENYSYGGQFLAIVKDDLEGADFLYRKGLEIYPDDYKLNFGAGFLNYYEIGNFEKGIKLLEKIVDHPMAPVFLLSIVNKLKLATGVDIKEVFTLVSHNYATTKDSALKNKLKRDLYALKAEIDLKCLNNGLGNCEYVDLDGVAYIKEGHRYSSSQFFNRYLINKREANPLPSHEKLINYIK